MKLSDITEEYVGGLRYVKETFRKVELDLSSPYISVITGPRRCGKTFILLKTVRNLLQRGGMRSIFPLTTLSYAYPIGSWQRRCVRSSKREEFSSF